MLMSVFEPCSFKVDVICLTRQFEDADMHVGSICCCGQNCGQAAPTIYFSFQLQTVHAQDHRDQHLHVHKFKDILRLEFCSGTCQHACWTSRKLVNSALNWCGVALADVQDL